LPRLDECRTSLLDELLGRYGPLPLPGGGLVDSSSPFESIIRAGLGLVADARIASAALDALRDAGLLEAHALASVDPTEVDDLFRASKVRLAARAVRSLQRVARWVAEHGFDTEQAASWSTESLREQWRGLNGVGPATADSLLLFGLGRPTYPVDRSTYRVLVRHGWLEPSASYDEARSVAEGIAPDDPESLARLSMAFERLGRECCKPSVARCDRCPLQVMLPPDGPVEIGE
jgi:endonuclease III related protein